MSLKKLRTSSSGKTLSQAEEQSKINEIRTLIGPIASKFPMQCSNASILRFLEARNWNTKKASRMLKETLKWHLEYKPEKIQWEDVAREAETGKLYKANYLDNFGRTVLIMRPGFENTTSAEGQIKYLVYCMENALSNINGGEEQMVWLIDFHGWNMGGMSMKVTRETARILQDRYPERLGVAILYNPPKSFESFWMMVKPFLERKTYKKVKFVYSDQPQSMKTMEALFDQKKLESAFGGDSMDNFDFEAYAKRMKDSEKKKFDAKNPDVASASDQTSIFASEPQQNPDNASPSDLASITFESQQLDVLSDVGSEASDEDDPLSYNSEALSELETFDQMGSLDIHCENENGDSQGAKK